MEAFLFSMAGMLCFGISNCLWRPLYHYNSPWQVMWKRSVFTAPFMTAIIFLFFQQKVTQLHPVDYLRPLPWIMLSYLGLVFFTRSLVSQPAGVSGVLILFLGIFGSLVAFYDGAAELPAHLPLILLLYISGFLLIDSGLLVQRKRPDSGNLMALSAALCWALASYGMKKTMMTTGPWVMGSLQEWTVFSISGMVVLYTSRGKDYLPNPQTSGFKTVFPVVVLALLTIAGVVMTNLSMHRLNLFQIALVSMVQPASTLLFSRVVQNEKLNLREITGGLLLMAGAFLCMVEG